MPNNGRLHGEQPNGAVRNGNREAKSDAIAAAHRVSRIEGLPAELLQQIFSHLDHRTLCILESVSSSIRKSVELQGWKAWLDNSDEARVVNALGPAAPRPSKTAAKSLLKTNVAWECHSILARQVEFIHFPQPIGPGSSGRKNKKGQASRNTNSSGSTGNMSYQTKLRYTLAIPLLALHHGSGLYMAYKSTVSLWSAANLEQPTGISTAFPATFSLLPPGQSHDSATAWQDISAMQVIAHGLVAIGRANGQMEVWRAASGETKDNNPALIATLCDNGNDAFAPSGTLECLSYLGSHMLLAGAWKNGSIAIFDLTDVVATAAAAANSGQTTAMRPLPYCHWTAESRPWSIHLGVHSRSHLRQGEPTSSHPPPVWLAVGCQGVDFLYVHRDILSASPPAKVSLRTSNKHESAPHLSTYAMASSTPSSGLDVAVFPPNHLYAGCYDGMVRVWDVESTPPMEDEAVDTPYLLPLPPRYIDRYDPSPIYSMTLGVGPQSHSIAIGTTRHGIVKLFRVDEDSQHTKRQEEPHPNEGFSLYHAPPRGDFPTYSIAGEHGRVFCVGQGRVWEFDARPRSAQPALTDQSVGWYYHGQMELRETGDRGWVSVVTS